MLEKEKIWREIWKTMRENPEKVKTFLEILLIVVSVLGVLFSVIEKRNFSNFYGIPKDYVELELDKIIEKIIKIFLIILIYFVVFFINKETKKLEKNKVETIMFFILKNLANIVMGLLIGLIFYIIFSDILSFYIFEYIQDKMLKLSKMFYYFIFYGVIVLGILQFYFLFSERKWLRKIGKIIASLIFLGPIFLYILKDIVNDVAWKRSYEIIFKNNEELEVVLAKKEGKLLVAKGKIEENGMRKKLNIYPKVYKKIDSDNMELEYITFNEIMVDK